MKQDTFHLERSWTRRVVTDPLAYAPDGCHTVLSSFAELQNAP
jgi:hypothetical protein